MRKLFGIMAVLIMILVGVAVPVFAEPVNTEGGKGGAGILFGYKGQAWADYQVNDWFGLNSAYEDTNLKLGLNLRPSDRFGFKFGGSYNIDSESSYPYAGIDFLIPFGTNLKIAGFYDYQYKGEDWNRFETALRIQMYENHFIYAGVKGDIGPGVPIYEYNNASEGETKSPHLFLRGDFSWSIKRFDINLRPLLLVRGYYFHDYSVNYNFNENTALVFNMNSLDDFKFKYRAGLQFKY